MLHQAGHEAISLQLQYKPLPPLLVQVLGSDELAPGIHVAEFAARRRNLARLIPPGSIAIIPAASQAFITGVIPYPYRQDADFLYLTGVHQQAVAIIQTGGNADYEFSLFVPSPDFEVSKD